MLKSFQNTDTDSGNSSIKKILQNGSICKSSVLCYKDMYLFNPLKLLRQTFKMFMQKGFRDSLTYIEIALSLA